MQADELVSLVRVSNGYKILITAQGRLSLRSRYLASELAIGVGPVRIVPKGLRSFDAEDKDFFLELLPGPRRGDGLLVSTFATRYPLLFRGHVHGFRCTRHVSLQRSVETASPVGWGTGACTLGSGGNSTHFKVGLSPAPMATFPAAPPKIPYGGFSPVRLQVPGTAQFSRESSHVGRWLKCDPHIRHLPTQLALAFGIASAGRDPTSMCGASASDDSTWTQRSSLR